MGYNLKKIVGGSPDPPAGELGKKIKEGKEKRRKITFKKGEKALKCIFLGYNFKKKRKIICWGKKKIKKEGGGNDRNAQCIPLDSFSMKALKVSGPGNTASLLEFSEELLVKAERVSGSGNTES